MRAHSRMGLDLLRARHFLLLRGQTLSEFGVDHVRVDGVGDWRHVRTRAREGERYRDPLGIW
jgi:hypothetical protein